MLTKQMIKLYPPEVRQLKVFDYSLSVFPIWTHVHQIIQLSDMCCLEETLAKLVCCDIFLQTAAISMQFLLPTRRNKEFITLMILTT